jgi:hypothetical protein
MIGKGIYEFDVTINGEQKKVGFKFNMQAAAETEKLAKMPIIDLFKRIYSNEDTAASLLQYFYGGWYAYNAAHRVKIDSDVNYNLSEVSDIMEEIGLEKCMHIFSDSIQASLPKNSPALEPTKKSQGKGQTSKA